TDLLTAFDYHDTILQFAAQKFGVDLQGARIATLQPEQIEKFPDEVRPVVRDLADQYQSMQSALRSAQSGHVTNAIAFAQRVWRRPLQPAERERLLAFYNSQLQSNEGNHDRAVRALLARILVSPDFLYRAERPTETDVSTLTDWELASRLSFFLWSSIP